MAREHVVERGETLVAIGLDAGFRTLRAIREHPANAGLFAARPDPNLLQPGDRLTIPDLTVRQEACQSEQEHVFRAKTVKVFFRTLLRDDEDQICAGSKYRLEFDGRTVEGTTTAAGMIEQEIRASTREVSVTAWIDERDGEAGFTWKVKLRSYAPVENLEGLQKRLRNLGFDCGDPTGEMNDETQSAITDFQEHYGLDVTGEPDAVTRKTLAELHD